MKIVTTGATGFLGKSICDRLKDKHKFFHIASEGINKSIFPSIKDVDYDVLMHIGWGGASNNKDLNSDVQIQNIKQGIDLFNFALSIGVKHFVFFSTSWIYGKYDRICNENDACRPTNLYGFSKLKMEEIWTQLAKIHEVKLTIVRPFWIFGGGDKENRFIPQIIKKFLNNEPINLHPAQNLVDYLFINDFVSAIEFLLENKQNFQIYNICSGQGCEIKSLVRKIKALTNSKSEIKYDRPYPDNFNMQWVGCNNKLKNLGWRSNTNLEDGLIQTIGITKTGK
jgi:nucleoside-diphosphate-sugar epimerase